MIREPWLTRARGLLAEIEASIAAGKTHLVDLASQLARLIDAAEAREIERAPDRRRRQLARYDREIGAARARDWTHTVESLRREREEVEAS